MKKRGLEKMNEMKKKTVDANVEHNLIDIPSPQTLPQT